MGLDRDNEASETNDTEAPVAFLATTYAFAALAAANAAAHKSSAF